MDIELFYVANCPHRETARHRLDAALAERGLAAVVLEREVASPEDADRFGMRGSATIRVDGRDPFADPDARPSLSCRLYGGEHGAAGAHRGAARRCPRLVTTPARMGVTGADDR